MQLKINGGLIMLKLSKTLLGFCLVLLLSLIFFSGCAKLKRKGTPTENENPQIFFANIPTDSSMFSANPTVYWYGTDVDGWIERYQYVVVKESTTATHGGPDGFITDVLQNMTVAAWRDSLRALGYFAKDTSITQDKIRMYATYNPNDTTRQYLFVRAVDDDNFTSLIIYRFFLRKNHPPETYVEFNSASWNFCLPETTSLWKGITISWSGSDSLDYPGRQPEFEFKWQLLGPFPDTSINKDTVTVPLKYFSWDTLTNSEFVTSTSALFFNLDNYPGRKFGWYLFRVQTRDDAFTLDRTPATSFIRVVKPEEILAPMTGHKSVLLVDATQGYTDYYTGTGAPKDSAVTRAFFRQILNNLQTKGVIDKWGMADLGRPAPLPPAETTMASYKVILIINDNVMSSGNSDTCISMYQRYLNLGGRLWMMGINNFRRAMTSEKWYMATTFTPPIWRDVAENYFHLIGIYSQAWHYGDSTLAGRNENFMGVTAYGDNPLGLPDCQIDTSKLIYYRDFKDSVSYMDSFYYYRYPPGVNVLALDVARANRVYSFVSYLGPVSIMDGRPTGFTAIGPAGRTPIFKCAEFCFPLFPLKDAQAEELVEKMLTNFFFVPFNQNVP
jgi:hypothetical protein